VPSAGLADGRQDGYFQKPSCGAAASSSSTDPTTSIWRCPRRAEQWLRERFRENMVFEVDRRGQRTTR